LLFIWVTFVTVIPKAAVMVAARISPIPSVHEINAEKEEFQKEEQAKLLPEMTKWQQEHTFQGDPGNQEQIAAYQKELTDYIAEIQIEFNSKVEEHNALIDEGYHAKRLKQQMLALNFSRISPASALMIGAMSLGKTGIEEHERFLNSIRSYKPIYSEWATNKAMKSLDFTKIAEGKMPEIDISDMPEHNFKPESLRNSFARVLPDFFIMIGFIIVFFVGAYVSFLRYDIR